MLVSVYLFLLSLNKGTNKNSEAQDDNTQEEEKKQHRAFFILFEGRMAPLIVCVGKHTPLSTRLKKI